MNKRNTKNILIIALPVLLLFITFSSLKWISDDGCVDNNLNSKNDDVDYIVSDYKNETMAHASNIYSSNGYLFMTYFSSETGHKETIGEDINARIAKIDPNNMCEPEFVTYAQKGSVIGDFTQSQHFAPYDAILIDKDDSTYSLVSVLTPSSTEKPGIYQRCFDKDTLAFENTVIRSTFVYSVNGHTYSVPMDVDNLSVFIDRITGSESGSRTIGTYPIITRAIPYEDGYCYSYLGGLQTGSQVGFCGCIIRTNDYGATWEYVSYNSTLDFIIKMWEGACLPYKGKIYCLLRATDDRERSYNLAMYYDMKNGTWGEYIQLSGYKIGTSEKVDEMIDPNTGENVMVSSGDSRPFIYQNDGIIYLMAQSLPLLKTEWSEQTEQSEGVYRSHVRIYKCDENLNILDKKSIFGENGMHYFSICDSENGSWFAFSEDRRHTDVNCKGNISVRKLDFIPF